MTIRNFTILIIIFMTLIAGSLYADELCPETDQKPAPSGADELKMFENQFNFDDAISSLNYLEKDVYKILKEHEKTESVLRSVNFYISYPNSIKFVKGTLLRQRALIAKEKVEIARMKKANNTGTIEEKEKAEQEFIQARDKFCKFLESAEYVD